jgi:cell division protein FtsI (penicillin-binding protein 3)
MVGDENKGQDGIEHEFNDDLSPKKDEDGKRIILTIDVKIQHILEQIAETTLKTNAAESIMLTAMNPQTGEILGSASLPHFDPNTYNQFPGTILRYQPALFTYEPGSVFKIFTVASLLDTDAITDNSTFVCNGHYNKVSPIITDLVSHGTVNAEKIIAYSCNVGVSIASERINSAAFYNKLYSFGFGNRIGSGSPSESSGIFHSVDTWDPRSKPTLAIGQGISVTMLQMLQAATALANNGVMVQPRVVLGIQDDKGNIKPYKTREPRQVINQGTAQSIIRDMSASTNNDGTAWRAAIGDIPMAVKTGTAQVSVNGVYSDTDFIASCMAIFPADNPTLILYVVIVNPQGQSYLGGQIATLPVKEAAESLVNYLGISRERNVHIDAVQFQEQPIQTPPHLEDVMPNLIGYSKQNLIPLLDQDSFYIKINGSGHVRQQVPAVGVQLILGDSITLYLE